MFNPSRSLWVSKANIKKQKVIGLMKGEISGKIMQEFLRLWAKIYSYLTDESKREKDTNE